MDGCKLLKLEKREMKQPTATVHKITYDPVFGYVVTFRETARANEYILDENSIKTRIENLKKQAPDYDVTAENMALDEINRLRSLQK